MIMRADRVRALLTFLVGAVVAVCTVALASAPAQAAPAWTVTSVPATKPVQPHAQFEAVSCPSSTFCLAVGSHVAVDGRFAPLAETFDGKAWHVSTTSVPGSGADGFRSVSCVDKSFCVASTIGSGVARLARWNGKTWSLQSLGTARPDNLSDVQCRSHRFCMAIGSIGQKAAAWHWNGHAWYRQTLPAPTKHYLSGVSCPTTTTCFAAGTTNTTDNGLAYVVHWTGKSWHDSALPHKAGMLSDISCLSTTRCTGVGNDPSLHGGGLVVDLAGGKWRYSYVKTSAYYPNGAAVSCTKVACTAILTFEVDEGIMTSIAVRGKTGGFVKSAARYPDLHALSCAGSSCIVVGSTLVSDRSGFTIGSNPTPATAYRRHGSTLAKFSVPQPDGRVANRFDRISCAGGLCAAIDGEGTSGSVWLRKSATTSWQPVAGTANAPYVNVSCSSTTFCMAVGRGISLSYDGTAWTKHAIPQPQGNGKDDIFGVSCVSPIWCEAVGTTGTAGNENKVLAVHWSGASWAVETAPSPSGTNPLSALEGISCTSTADCLAVGYQLGGGEPRPIVEKFHDAAWTMASTSGLPASTSLADVSCWSATGCMVTSPGDFGAATAATWNGTGFTQHPIIGDTPTANGVSCVAATSCTVAGVYFGVNRYGSQLVEHWDGSAWQLVATPTVIGDQPTFQDVSCAASGACTAVGSVGRAYDVALAANGTV